MRKKLLQRYQILLHESKLDEGRQLLEKQSAISEDNNGTTPGPEFRLSTPWFFFNGSDLQLLLPPKNNHMMSPSHNHNSTHNPKLLFIIFTRESSLHRPTLIYRSEETAIQWCTQQLQTHIIKRYPNENDQQTPSMGSSDPTINTVEIIAPSEGKEDLEVVYTIKRCERGDTPQVIPPKEKKTKERLWVLHDKVKALVRGTYLSDKAAWEGWKKDEQRYSWHNTGLRRVSFGNE